MSEELRSISETKRRATDALIEELGICLTRLTNAYSAYEARLQQLGQHERLGMVDAPPSRGPGRSALFSREEEEKYICEPYWAAQRADKPISVRAIAHHLGCNRATVGRALVRYRDNHPELVAKLERSRSKRKQAMTNRHKPDTSRLDPGRSHVRQYAATSPVRHGPPAPIRADEPDELELCMQRVAARRREKLTLEQRWEQEQAAEQAESASTEEPHP